jgi:hypothetical protein
LTGRNAGPFELQKVVVQDELDLHLGSNVVDQFMGTEVVKLVYEIIDADPSRPLVVIGCRATDGPDVGPVSVEGVRSIDDTFAPVQYIDGRKVATEHELKQKQISNRSVFLNRIYDYMRLDTPDNARVGSTPIVSDKRFIDCNIYGPAVIYLEKETKIIDCVWNWGGDDPGLFHESNFLEVKDNSGLAGATALQFCELKNCNLIQLTVAGTAEELAHFKKGIDLSRLGK